MKIENNFNWYKLAKKAKHSYSWVYLDLPEEIQSLIIQFGQEIDPNDLYEDEGEDGLETDPHVTVKYALLTDESEGVKDQLEDEKKGKVYLGESSIFEGDKYDVVKIDVESKDLTKLHDKLNALPHEDRFPEYHPHATIAYVKKGKGKKYIGKFKIDEYFRFKEVFFGDTKEHDTKIKLSENQILWYRSARLSIPTIASQVRNQLVQCYGGDKDCLKEKCLKASRALKAQLLRAGYIATVTRGAFRVDRPDPEAIKMMDAEGYASEELRKDDKKNPGHYWVEVEDLLIDITGDQFNNELEGEKIPKVNIGKRSSMSRYTTIEEDYI